MVKGKLLTCLVYRRKHTGSHTHILANFEQSKPSVEKRQERIASLTPSIILETIQLKPNTYIFMAHWDRHMMIILHLYTWNNSQHNI